MKAQTLTCHPLFLRGGSSCGTEMVCRIIVLGIMYNPHYLEILNAKKH